MDTSRPTILNVKRRDDGVALLISGVEIGLPVATARQLAETILATVGEIEGREYMLVAAGYKWGTIKTRDE